MPGIDKELTRSLIRYFTKIELGGCYSDASTKSLFELGRQVTAPALFKANPKLVVDIQPVPYGSPMYLRVEYINGLKLDIDPISLTCSELRYQLYKTAEDIEVDYDVNGNNPIVGEDDDDVAEKTATKKK